MSDPTYYELVLQRGDTKYLIAYVQQPSGRNMRQAAGKRYRSILRIAGEPTDTDKLRGGTGRNSVLEWNGWEVKYTGRTERFAKQEGAYPYVGND